VASWKRKKDRKRERAKGKREKREEEGREEGVEGGKGKKRRREKGAMFSKKIYVDFDKLPKVYIIESVDRDKHEPNVGVGDRHS